MKELDQHRKLISGTVYAFGYLFVGEKIQYMEPGDFLRFANAISHIFKQIGLEPDTDFFRWQMSDFFGAASYAVLFSFFMKNFFKTFGAFRVLNKDEQWWESQVNLGAACSVGILLALYEVFQANSSNSPIDTKDLIAYLAGLGMYLGSENPWNGYLQLKEKIRLKLLAK